MEKIIAASLLFITIFLAIDIYQDLTEGVSFLHAIFEVTSLLISATAFFSYLLNFLRDSSGERALLVTQLQSVSQDRDSWRIRASKYIEGLSSAIDEQFEKWKLSDSEKEIGLLMLKGLSHKEIANIRNTSERTVRQQAVSLYSKAGIENRSQLAAFFLEDLVIPQKDRA